MDNDEILDALVSALAERMQPPPPPVVAPAPDPPAPPPMPRKRRKVREKSPPRDGWARERQPSPPPVPKARLVTRWDRTLVKWRKKHGGGKIPERGTPEYEALVKMYYKTK
tara:strand:+ start:2181 stop:2513 length:333 start_codon:yes stop_codon:yes gene_type:complete